MTHPLIKDATALTHIPDHKLVNRFKTKSKGKLRSVNNPHPELKTVLKDWNQFVTEHYINMLHNQDIYDIPHAYMPNKSIQSNAAAHKQSNIIQFDFSGFYDSCQYHYFEPVLRDLDPHIDDANTKLIKRLLIDPETNGVTQGLPVSGALAGITLIPFWVELKKQLPENIRFTQYSDDLTFSYTGAKTPDCFTIPELTKYINQALSATNLEFKLNADKTRSQKSNYRKITGIRINHNNQATPSRVDYRFLRHALYILSKSDDLNAELDRWGFQSKESFIGKISYIRSIDDTGKIDRIIMKHRDVCHKHNIFTTWIKQNDNYSAFA